MYIATLIKKTFYVLKRLETGDLDPNDSKNYLQSLSQKKAQLN